jgi:hypothetical protein
MSRECKQFCVHLCPKAKTRQPKPARLLLCLPRTNQLFLAARFVAVFFAVDLVEAVFEAVLPPAAFGEEAFFAPPEVALFIAVFLVEADFLPPVFLVTGILILPKWNQ